VTAQSSQLRSNEIPAIGGLERVEPKVHKVSRPLGAAEAAAACHPFRAHPRWALIENAPVMSRLWEIVAAPGCPRRRIFDARIGLTLLHHGVRELATRNATIVSGLGAVDTQAAPWPGSPGR